ncbi:MAG: multiheme c-type cytochrome [Rubrivivax sp.]|nr:multiheme c-type cytochrome [Rubrivivax sp.]
MTFGDAALAAFVLCAVSGVLLAAGFDARDGVRSIGEWLLANPGATYLRNLHYWTAQAFLVLTVLHGWDHLRRGTEVRVAPGVWLRLVASLPVLAFLMLSGFLLRADADAQQARRIFEEIVRLVPLAGPLLETFLFGPDEGALQVVYLHHAATATLIVWLVIIDHARRVWGGARAMLAATLGAGVLALLVSPGLHDALDPVIKGPWYFLGLQEGLHWTPWPLLVVGLLTAALVFVWSIPRWTPRAATRTKRGLFAAVAGYFVLCVVVLFVRGENWSLRPAGPAWPAGPGDLHAGPALTRAGIDAGTATLPLILGRPEGCMTCHAEMSGFSPAHQPQGIGCASCHLGNIFTLDQRRAHAGMVLVPGNIADAGRTCGQSACHADVVPRVERSIMATFAGVIATNRKVFGEDGVAGHGAAAPPHVRDLGHSAADSHLRQLCVGCHLGQPKTLWGPITQESRGGGCNACHLKYSPAADAALAAYVPEVPDWNEDGSPPVPPPPSGRPFPKVHPRLSVQADGSHCFGCHSRSSRIATSFEGWHELRHDPSVAELDANPAQYRQLDDTRFFVRKSADVHHTAGLDCIDCHTALEVMGSGQAVAHKAQALRVRCEDCHAPAGAPLNSLDASAIDPESRKILTLRGWTIPPGERVGATRSGDTLLNVTVDAQGRGQLRRKATGQPAPLKPQAAICAQGGGPANGHQRLSCSSCHTAWAPQCTSCHTAFDPKSEGHDHLAARFVQGEWMESSVEFESGPPALGVRIASGRGERGGETVDTFVPGMILTIDRNLQAGRPPDTVFRRLFAPTAAHTTQRQVRACESCHNDPVALGYGKGTLRFTVADPPAKAAVAHGSGGQTGQTGQTGHTGRAGAWRFTPAQPASPHDGLPEDAWTGFLAERSGMVSTQAGARPFTVAEQRRILTVGSCLTCHKGDSAVMRESVRDFPELLRRRSAQCAVPVWD